jgi:hypothetical protein
MHDWAHCQKCFKASVSETFSKTPKIRNFLCLNILLVKLEDICFKINFYQCVGQGRKRQPPSEGFSMPVTFFPLAHARENVQ